MISFKVSNQRIRIALVILCSLLNLTLAQDGKTMEWKSTISSGQIKYIPNVSYLGQGYNLFYGNPQSIDGLDPGYRNVPIVELQYQDNLWDSVTPDRAYFIPDGVRLTNEKSCLISFSSREVTSLKQYQDNLGLQVSGSGEIFSASFSASADFKLMQSQLSQSDTQCIQSQATCSVFHLSLYNTVTSIPLLSSEVVDKLTYLDSMKDFINEKEYYYDFFENWGTHVATSVQLGSIFGYKFTMQQSEVQRQSSLGLDVTVGASLYGVSGKVNTDYQQTQLNNFQSAMNSWSSYSIGAIPNEDQDAVQWAMQTLDRPMPIKTELTPIYNFVQQYSNSTDTTGFTSDQILNIVTKMKQFMPLYCSDRLKFSSQLDSCNGYVQSETNSYIGTKRIQNIKSTKSIEYNTQNLSVYQKTDSSSNINQQFIVSRPLNDENTYQIMVNDNSGLCLGVKQIAVNQPLIPKACSQDLMTLFSIEEIGQGFQYISLLGSQYFLTVESTAAIFDIADNARIIITTNVSTCRGCTFFKFI